MATVNDHNDRPSSQRGQQHRPFMHSIPDARQQSFDEIYGAPENRLEVEINKTDTVRPGPYDKWRPYTVYIITCNTNNPNLTNRETIVARRYSDFEYFRDLLERRSARVTIHPLPGKTGPFTDPMSPEVVEHRKEKLGEFIQQVASHPLLLNQCKDLVVPFIQDPNWDREAY